MICKSECHRSVANAESWSNMLIRYCRLLHSVSLLHSPELDLWKNTCAGKCSECGKQSAQIYQTHYYCVRAECSQLFSMSRESLGRRHEGSKSLRSTSITTTPLESNTKQSTFSELSERLGSFHESAKLLADRLHTSDIIGQKDPNMVEAAKHLDQTAEKGE